jgi:4-oxalmesaconate hydratase
MIIDCHGHYTTAPRALRRYRKALLENESVGGPPPATPVISGDDIRNSLEGAQLLIQRKRGTDLTLFSPMAAAMAHHQGNEQTSRAWAKACNDLIYQVCRLYPQNFAGVGQLPQGPGRSPADSVAELKRCVEELGFAGCLINPDPSGGYWTDPPLSDTWWYPLYEAMVELDVPGMIHVSAACNPNFHTTGSHYLVADTAAFMQLMTSTVFKDFPQLRLILPHGGGAVPYHWGRYRGMAQDQGLPPLNELMLENVYFDTCVYHEPGIQLLTEVIPATNILFASEMVGAVRGIDPQTGHYFDDTRRYIESASSLSGPDRAQIFSGNTLRVFPRVAAAAALIGSAAADR